MAFGEAAFCASSGAACEPPADPTGSRMSAPWQLGADAIDKPADNPAERARQAGPANPGPSPGRRASSGLRRGCADRALRRRLPAVPPRDRAVPRAVVRAPPIQAGVSSGSWRTRLTSMHRTQGDTVVGWAKLGKPAPRCPGRPGDGILFRDADSGPPAHQTTIGSPATIASPALQPKACAKALIWLIGPSTRQRPGEWPSVRSWSTRASGRALTRHSKALLVK